MSCHVTRHLFSIALGMSLGGAAVACSSSGGPDSSAEAGSETAGTGGGIDTDSPPEPDAGADELSPPDPTPEPDAQGPCGRSGEGCCPGPDACEIGLTCSDQFCLTCGAPPVPHEGCSNVALGALASAQQTYAGNPLAALNDNDVCVAWGSGDYPDIEGSAVRGTWLELDLLEPKTLDAMSFWVKQTPASAEVTLTFAYSTDGETWTAWPTEAGVSKPLEDNAPWALDFVPAITARFFKITFVKSPSFVSMRELALYSCPLP
jgi:hypothetical protein